MLSMKFNDEVVNQIIGNREKITLVESNTNMAGNLSSLYSCYCPDTSHC